MNNNYDSGTRKRSIKIIPVCTADSGITERYDYRILSEKDKVTNDSRISGLSNNVMIIAGTGAGKTGSYLYPNIKSAKNQSMIISDSKGQLSKTFSSELRRKGYTVKRISMIDWSRSCSYNPLNYIHRNSDGSLKYQDVVKLSQSIITSKQSNDPIWDQSAQSVLQFLIGYVMEFLPKEDHTMMTICRLYHSMIESSCGFDMFRETCQDHPDSFPAMKLSEIEANSKADKMLSSIYGFVNVALTPFEFPESKVLFGNHDLVDIKKLGTSKMAIFLEVSDTDHSFDEIQNLIFTQTLQELVYEADQNPDGRLKVPVSIMMDDFAANMNIPDFDKIISVTRSRDIGVSIICQSLSQLESVYGKPRATTIMNNCDTIIYMGAQDLETAGYVGTRACRSQESILSMPRDMEYLIMSGQKARLVKKIKPYQYSEEMSADKDKGVTDNIREHQPVE